MKIDEISKQIEVVSHSAESTSRAKAESAGIRATRSSDDQEPATKIELSKASVEYRKVAEAAESEQTGRSERVSQLREAIEKDQYGVASSRVAEKVILESLMEAVKP